MKKLTLYTIVALVLVGCSEPDFWATHENTPLLELPNGSLVAEHPTHIEIGTPDSWPQPTLTVNFQKDKQLVDTVVMTAANGKFRLVKEEEWQELQDAKMLQDCHMDSFVQAMQKRVESTPQINWAGTLRPAKDTIVELTFDGEAWRETSRRGSATISGLLIGSATLNIGETTNGN